MKRSDVPENVIEKAEQIYLSLVRDAHLGIEKFPEDDWYYIFDTWDLNVYLDESNCSCASLYKVVDGETDCDDWYSLFPRGE